jgi:hypothetical protein
MEKGHLVQVAGLTAWLTKAAPPKVTYSPKLDAHVDVPADLRFTRTSTGSIVVQLVVVVRAEEAFTVTRENVGADRHRWGVTAAYGVGGDAARFYGGLAWRVRDRVSVTVGTGLDGDNAGGVAYGVSYDISGIVDSVTKGLSSETGGSAAGAGNAGAGSSGSTTK